MIPLSVLDHATVATGSTPAQALRETTEMARIVERLGYYRHWVGEYHSMSAIASSAPAVLVAHLANATSTLRIGAGGVILPNHSPLAVAEQFATLEALHPGRIDLGLPFAFAYHFAPNLLDPALSIYRATFQPSLLLEEPRVMVAVSVLCAPTTDEAQWLSRSTALSILQRRSGDVGLLMSPEEADVY